MANKKELSDDNEVFKKYKNRGIKKNNKIPVTLWSIEVIAVIGNLIRNKFKKICLFFTFHHIKTKKYNYNYHYIK